MDTSFLRNAGSELPGWPVGSAVEWVMTTGRQSGRTADLLDGLSSLLTDLGAPVWRTRFTYWTLHPLVRAYVAIWLRDRGSTEERFAKHGFQSGPMFVGSPFEHVTLSGQPFRRKLDDLGPDDHRILSEIAEDGGTDYTAMPLMFSDGEINIFAIATDQPGGFSEDDLKKFNMLCVALAPVIETQAAYRTTRTILNTYLGTRSGDKVLDGQIKRGDGEEITAAIWFNDLRRSTELTELDSPDKALEILNDYFAAVHEVISEHRGEVLRFIGDAMLAVFPVDDASATACRDACQRASDAATEAMAAIGTLNETRDWADMFKVEMGVGLTMGTVVYGNIGAPTRLEFTVMGTAANLAARVESMTKETGHSILLTDAIGQNLDAPPRSLGSFDLRGFDEPLELFTLPEGASRLPNEPD